MELPSECYKKYNLRLLFYAKSIKQFEWGGGGAATANFVKKMKTLYSSCNPRSFFSNFSIFLFF